MAAAKGRIKKTAGKKRADQTMVDQGLVSSREKAKRAIMAGLVRIGDRMIHKASDLVRADDPLELKEPERFVSRGGYKLEHALDHFQLDVKGLRAVDLGASTGGFTDCLLQRGATQVFAVDVGTGQLSWKLREDDRVVVLEKTNARFLEYAALKKLDPSLEAVDLVVMDCSFISLKKILPAAENLIRSNTCSVAGSGSGFPPGIVALVKPQFEAGKAEVDRGEGVIRDPEIHQRVLLELETFVTESTNMKWKGYVESPITGPAGNVEFLALLEKSE